MTGDVPPGVVYIDTSLVIAAILSGSANHVVARDYGRALSGAGSAIYFSQILRMELLQALRKIGTDPRGMRGSVRREYRLQHWGRLESVREHWLRYGLAEFDRFLRQFRAAYEVAMTTDIVAEAVIGMARYNLKSNDAIHLATARSIGVEQLATLDADFAGIGEPAVAVIRL